MNISTSFFMQYVQRIVLERTWRLRFFLHSSKSYSRAKLEELRITISIFWSKTFLLAYEIGVWGRLPHTHSSQNPSESKDPSSIWPRRGGVLIQIENVKWCLKILNNVTKIAYFDVEITKWRFFSSKHKTM